MAGQFKMVKIEVQPMNAQDRTVQLRLEEHATWLDAILTNDPAAVEFILANSDADERYALLNGYFDFSGSEPLLPASADSRENKFTFSHAWHMAVALGSRDVVRSFIQHDCNVLIVDPEGRNAIHCLVYVSFMREELQEETLLTYKTIHQHVSRKDLHDLLLQETSDGLRPLEFALHLGASHLAAQMFHTSALYSTRHQYQGTSCRAWCDVTEYEIRNERQNRIFILLAMYDRDKVDDDDFKQFFFHPAIQNWLKIKIRILCPFLVLWFLCRALFGFCVFVGQLVLFSEEEHSRIDARNSSDLDTVCTHNKFIWRRNFKVPGYCLICLCLLYSFLQILFDIGENYYLFFSPRFRWMIETPMGRKTPLVHMVFYRITQLLLYVFVICNLSVRLIRLHTDHSIPLEMDDLTFIGAILCLFWTVLQFIQLLPYVGHFVVTLQRLIVTLFLFLFVFAIFLFNFGEIFVHILNVGHVTCRKGFEFSGFHFFYSTFLLSLHMLNLRKVDGYENLMLYTVHTIYVFVITIMLINFLTALFSNTVAWVNRRKDLMLGIQQLNMLTVLEHRLTHIPCLDGYLKKHKETKIPYTSVAKSGAL